MIRGFSVLIIAFGLLVLAAPSTGEKGGETGKDRWTCHDNSMEPTEQQQVVPSYI